MKISVIATSATITCFYLASGILPNGPLRLFLINPIPFEFCMGLCLAWAFAARTEQRKPWPIGISLSAVGCVLLAIAPLFIPHSSTNNLPGFPRVAAWGVPAVLVAAGFLPVAQPQRALTRFAVLLGDASYSLYLTHAFIMPVYARIVKTSVIGSINQVFFVPLVVAVAIFVAILAHLTIERPLIELIRSLTVRPLRQARPPASPI